MPQVKRSAFTTLPTNKQQRKSRRLNKIHTSQLNSHAFYTEEAYRNELSRPSTTRPSTTSISPINIMRSKSNKTIYFFATEHSSDQTHTQFQLFKTHLSDSKPPDIIISESILNSEAFLTQYTEYSKTEPKDNVAEQFLKTSFRECGYAAALVLQKNPKCKLLCPEPSKEAIFSYLCNKYPRKYVFFYEMAELIMTYYHLKTDDSLRQWIDKSLGKYERSVMERNPSFWNGFDFSCDKFTQLFEDEIITELNKMPTKDYLLYTEFLPKK